MMIVMSNFILNILNFGSAKPIVNFSIYRLLTNFFCSSSLFLTSASFLCCRAAFHRGNFGLSSSTGSVGGVSAVLVTGTLMSVAVVSILVAVVSTLVAAVSTSVAASSPFVAIPSFVVTTVSFTVSLAFIDFLVFVDFFVFVEFFEFVISFVVSFVAWTSSSGITRPKLHYMKVMCLAPSHNNALVQLTTTKFFLGGGAFLRIPRKSRISESNVSLCCFAPINL